MKRLKAAAAALICLPLLASCGNPGEFSDSEKLSATVTRSTDYTTTYNFAEDASEPPTSYAAYTGGVTELALTQLRVRAESEKSSFIFSPASASLQLGLLANAASSDARQEILMNLGTGLTLGDVNACSSYFKSRMESVSGIGQKEAPAEQVKFTSAMLLDKGVDVKSVFLQTNADFYGCDIFRYDFSGDNAAEKLNSYFSPFTADAAVDVSKGGTLQTVAAAKVTDGWLQAVSVEEGSFAGADGARQESFICSEELMLSSGKATAVLKYTEKNPLRLLLILPDEALGVDGYLKGFSATELNALIDSMDVTRRAAARIPAFSMESNGKAVPLSDTLTKSGLFTLFSDQKAFSAISYTQSAKIGEMYEIPPEFSLSAAGINAGNEKSGGAEAKKIEAAEELSFDRPFIFLLLDNESTIPVLAGVYR